MSAVGSSLRRLLRGVESRTGLPVAVWLLLAVAGTIACSSGSEAPAADAAAVEKRYEEGAFAVVARLNHDEITVADGLELTLTAISGEDQKVEFPAVEDRLEKFRVVGARDGAPKLLDNGKLQRRKIYELEPFLPGEYSIPPMAVVFGGAGDTDQIIETEPIVVKVRSVLPPVEGEPDIIEGRGPVELPGVDPWVYWLVAALVLLSGLAALLAWRKRRTKAKIEQAPVPPHEAAYRALEKLLAEDLIRKGKAKLFYLRLSNTLRRYIEDRFGLRAPERTTEEFLADLRGSDALESSHKDLLKAFLEHCDLVKFAEHRPSEEEIERAIAACKQFIAETERRGAAESKPAAVAQ